MGTFIIQNATSQIDEILQELRQHGLILKSEDIKQTATMMEKVITKGIRTGQSVMIMGVVKSVGNLRFLKSHINFC